MRKIMEKHKKLVENQRMIDFCGGVFAELDCLVFGLNIEITLPFLEIFREN